jgi:hypothetical protein
LVLKEQLFLLLPQEGLTASAKNGRCCFVFGEGVVGYLMRLLFEKMYSMKAMPMEPAPNETHIIVEAMSNIYVTLILLVM